MNSVRSVAAGRRTPLMWCCFMVVISPSVLFSGVVSGADRPSSEALALNDIFDGDQLIESALVTHQAAKKTGTEDRFEFLWQYVLPGPTHSDLRVRVSFTPTHPVLLSVDAGQETGSIGGQLVSPALDLVDVADQAGKLQLLESRLVELKVATQFGIVPVAGRTATPHLREKNRLALLLLVKLRQGNLNAALQHADNFVKLSNGETVSNSVHRAAEAILCVKAKAVPELWEILQDGFKRIVQKARVSNQWSLWSRQFKAVVLADVGRADTAGFAEAQRPLCWMPFGNVSAESRGGGIPQSQWMLSPGQAVNTASHGDDYLYFQSPVRGNFQFESDFTSFGWTDTELLACGTWVSPVYTHTAYDVGDVRNAYDRREISPKMSKIDAQMHYRTVIQDDAVATYVNGREVHTQPLVAKHDPWIAVRNDYKNEGRAVNVRATGKPEIPDRICLTASANLAGWISYLNESVGWSNSHWQPLYMGRREASADASLKERGGIFAKRSSEFLKGSHYEQALYYHRPMFENGEISYEFFYRDGDVAAHPAIDRLCFMIERSGVSTHWLTDGPFDRTPMSPDNSTELSNADFPLVNNAWNRFHLTLSGDSVELMLNGTVVGRQKLDTNNQRRFGFFHYADRSELRVRNVTWQGQWPKQLPSIAQQPLATDDALFLDKDNSHLHAVFEHDFVTDGLAQNRFALIYGALGKQFKETPKGLMASRKADRGYKNTTIAPYLQVYGDFDITVAYSEFKSEPAPTGSGRLLLVAMFEGENTEEVLIQRGHFVNRDGIQNQTLQAVVVENKRGGQSRQHFGTRSHEEVAGRLRLSRRGNMIYYLSAEGESPNFRILASREFSTSAIRSQGIRIINMTHQKCSSSVIWKRLTVRAESFSNPNEQTKDTAGDQNQ